MTWFCIYEPILHDVQTEQFCPELHLEAVYGPSEELALFTSIAIFHISIMHGNLAEMIVGMVWTHRLQTISLFFCQSHPDQKAYVKMDS